MLELNNGFKKGIYMSKEDMELHAITYSMGYKAKKGYTFWEKNFDEMGLKTMLRQLISKWGIMSIQMQNAYTSDMGVIKQDGTVDYIDNQGEVRENTDEVIENVISDEVEEVEV